VAIFNAVIYPLPGPAAYRIVGCGALVQAPQGCGTYVTHGQEKPGEKQNGTTPGGFGPPTEAVGSLVVNKTSFIDS
jgi:hypothetical protein